MLAMGWFERSRWFGGNMRVGAGESAPEVARRDANVREAFGLTRWFAGLGAASPEARARETSPESDARIRDALNSLPLTLFEFDARGAYTCVAGRYIGLFGITPAQIIGRSVFDFPKLVPGKNLMVRRALAGEAVTFTGIWPLGRFMIRLQPRFDRDGQLVSVVGLGYELAQPAAADEQIDQLMQALRESEARFRAMCESAPLGIYVTNATFELGYVNPALCALLGRGSEELVGRHLQMALNAERVVPLDPSRVAATAGDVAADGTLHLVRPDGSRVWVSLRTAEMRDGGELLGHLGAVTDISRERAAQQAIDRAQQDLRRVIETSPEGIGVVRCGRWVFINRALGEALGYAQAGVLIGQHAGAMVHPDDLQRAPELAAAPQSVTDGRVYELRCLKANGEYALMEIRWALLTEFEGAPAVLITARDITERKKLQTQLLVSERLLSVGTLAAGVAHEINNPLAAALSNLEWVEARLTKLNSAPSHAVSDLQAEFVRLAKPIGEAREAAERVRAIVHDLKLFSRSEEELKGPVSLMPVLDSAARMAWHEVRQRARFVREYGDLPAVHGSDARLGQVFLNLIINAAQAIPEGHADEHEIRVSARIEPEHVVVEVRDTGSGIPNAILDHIFDPFFTTKPPGVGTGLGLAICHRIVTSLDGQIEVDSQPGSGSAFRVTLLRAAHGVTSEPPKPTGQIPAEPAASRGRVLIIDDDPAMANAIGLVLGEEHDVEVFTSARRALNRLLEGEHYDAIVCDVMMPDMNGMDFHAELASRGSERAAAVIFLTGGAFTVRAREFLDRIPNPRLDKPFDAESLRRLIRRQLSRGI